MQQDENTQDVPLEQQEEQSEVEDTTTEETDEVSKEKDDKVTLSPAEYRHFKKWQASKGQPEKKVATQISPLSEEQVEMKILKAQGINSELLTKLSQVAKATGKSLIEAQTDEIFVAIKEKYEAETKKLKASLGASKGSGQVKGEKTFNSQGLSDDEHKALWKKSQGR